MPISRGPSCLAIAFAATIVKTKPKGQSIEEYVNHLHQHLANGRRAHALSSTHQYLDPSSYWRSEAQRLEKALQESELQAAKLKHEIEILKKSTAVPETRRSRANKRVNANHELAKSTPVSKKARTNSSALHPVDMKEINEERSAQAIVLCGMYDIQTALKSEAICDPDGLAHHLVQAMTAVAQAIEQALVKCDAHAHSADTSLRASITACGRVIPVWLEGYKKLCKQHGGSRGVSLASYAIVKMFDTILKTIQASISPAHEKLASRNPKPKSASERVREKSVAIEDVSIMTCFLKGVLIQVMPEVGGLESLREGFLSCILSRLGDLLYPAIFGHMRGVSIEDEIRAAKLYDQEQPDAQAEKRLELEGPYLIQLLRQAVAEHGTSTSSEDTTKPTDPLSVTIKSRLQHTLMGAIFGTMDIGQYANLLANPLEMREIGETNTTQPTAEDLDVKDRFQREVWKVVGWETLAQMTSEYSRSS